MPDKKRKLEKKTDEDGRKLYKYEGDDFWVVDEGEE